MSIREVNGNGEDRYSIERTYALLHAEVFRLFDATHSLLNQPTPGPDWRVRLRAIASMLRRTADMFDEACDQGGMK